MKLEIDIGELSECMRSISALITEYEEIKMNLFKELRDSTTINWRDGNSVSFEQALHSESQETDLFLESLKIRKDLLNYIYTKYSVIGKKIKCDMGAKKGVLAQIDECHGRAVKIIEDFDDIDFSFTYHRIDDILNQKNKIISVRDELAEMKRRVSKMFEKIEKIENQIALRMKKLEEIKINDLDFTF